jgi:hypothetical protein
VNGATFTFLLIGTVLLIGALNFLPALALGPIVEHFLTLTVKRFSNSFPSAHRNQTNELENSFHAHVPQTHLPL